MNQQVKKIIKASLCNRKNWIKDSDAPNCFKCDQRFNIILRRRHHCRSCGNVFCQVCTQFFLKGPDLDEPELQIRLCQFCFKVCSKYIINNDPEYYKKEWIYFQNKDVLTNQRRSLIHQNSNSSSSQQQKKNFLKKITSQYDNVQLNSISTLRQKVYQKISLLTQIMLKQNKLSMSYWNLIYELIIKIMNQIPPNAMITKNMNICKNLMFRCIKNEQACVKMIINGVIIKKMSFIKRFLNAITNNSIILMYGGIQLSQILGNKSLSFEQLLENRKTMSIRIVDKIKELGIGIILLQESIQKQVLDLFAQRNIVVISKIRVQDITRVKTCLGIQYVVQNINKITNYKRQNIVGFPKKIYFTKMQTFQKQQISLIIEGDKSKNALTILLAGPSKPQLKKIKNQIKTLLMISRHLSLKMEKVWLDKKLIQSMNAKFINDYDCYPNLFFCWNYQKHQNTPLFLRQRHLSYGRAVFVQADYGPQYFSDISKQNIDQYLKARSNLFQKKWQYFTEICTPYKQLIKRFYSEQDMPMGQYILKKLLTHNQKCEICRKPLNQHIQIYYSTNLYVKIQIQSRIIQQSQQIQNSFSDQFQELYRSNRLQKIECYIQCETCRQQISSKFILSQSHIQLSLLSFLYGLFTATNTSFLKNIKLKQRNHCKHYKKCRVFQLGKSFLKVSINFLNIFKQFSINQIHKNQRLHQKDIKNIIQKCLLESHKIDQVTVFLYQQLKKMAQKAKNPNFQIMLKNPKASFLKAKSSFLTGGALSQSQYSQILIPQIIQQINRIKYLGQTLIHPKKIKTINQCIYSTQSLLYILRRLYKLIKQVQSLLNKQQLNQKYIIKHVQMQQSFLDNFDMNALIQQNESSQEAKSYNQNLSEQNNSQYTKTEIDFQMNQFEQWMGNNYEPQMTVRKKRKTESNIFKKNILEEDVLNIFKISLSQLKIQNNISVNQVKYEIPCNLYEPQSLIAGSLNSSFHKQTINYKKSNQILKIRFQSSQTQMFVQNQQIKKISNHLQMQQNIILNIKKQKSKVDLDNFNRFNVEVIILSPYQFQILRESKQISLDKYISTISSSDNWIVGNGKKSKNTFIRAHNDLLVIKKVHQKQFNNLKKMLHKYFQLVLHKETLLTLIYGAYEVHRSNKIQYYIVMQNLFFMMDHWYAYDLNGCREKRFSKPPIIPLDMNFILDRFSQPIFTVKNLLTQIEPILGFLVDFEIKDYSLILIFEVQTSEQQILVGSNIKLKIINYLHSAGMSQRLQKVIKGQWTNIDAKGYRDRLIAATRRYFAQIPQ